MRDGVEVFTFGGWVYMEIGSIGTLKSWEAGDGKQYGDKSRRVRRTLCASTRVV